MSAAAALAAMEGRSHVTPVMRAPLPPFPQPETYDHVPFTPPAGTDLYFYRGNFCGIRIAGAPVVPGGNPANPDLVMSCLLDNYPRAIQDRFLETYASYGYTHLQRSLGHALAYGSSFPDYVALSKRAQGVGLFCDQWLLGVHEYPLLSAPDQDGAFWAPILGPFIAALLDSGVLDSCCVSWQMDQLQQNAPGNPTISIIAYVCDALPSRVPVYTHWVNEALAWWKTGGEVWTDRFGSINVTDRFSWWLAMQPYLTGGYHQGNATMAMTDPKLYQDKMKDTLNPFTDGRMGHSIRNGSRNFALVTFESTGQKQFDGQCSEDQGDLAGYLLTCTLGDSGGVMAGYGNGARMPNGAPL